MTTSAAAEPMPLARGTTATRTVLGAHEGLGGCWPVHRGPIIFYQLWRFITPGLTRTERRYALPFIVGSQLMFAFGLVFELPLVLIFLSLAGLVQTASLRRARPYAVVAMVAVAAIVTPTTDAVTLLLMAAPMLAFYEFSILVAWLIERSRRRRSV